MGLNSFVEPFSCVPEAGSCAGVKYATPLAAGFSMFS